MEKKFGGSQILAKCLKKEGVELVFTLSGGHTMSMYYACLDEGIDVIDCRSEANAVIAADAYAKSTGKPGVLLTTAGPGVSNTVTGMMEAMTGRTPIVQIGGACPLVLQGTADLQDVDNVSVMKQCTKWARKVYTPYRIADFLDAAFRAATSGLPGPAYLEIAADILMDTCEEDMVTISAESRTDAIPYGDPAYIAKAAQMLVDAKRPLLVIGNTARYSAEPAGAIKALAEYLDMPVLATTVSRGRFIDEDDRLSVGAYAGKDVDVVLALCTANDMPLQKFQPPAYNAEAKFIMVAPESLNIGFNRTAQLGIVAGAAPAAAQILEVVKTLTGKRSNEAYIAELHARREAADAQLHDSIYGESEMVRPARCAMEVCNFLNEEGRDWTVVADGGDAGCWMNQLCRVHTGGSLAGLIGNGSIGLSPGTALGAYYGTRKPVLLYVGDGSFGYNCMEFSNYVKRKLPIIVVVSNDSAWGMVKGFEVVARENVYYEYEKDHFDSLATNLPFIRYDQIAEVLGGYGELVEKPEEIVPAIKRAVASGLPAIINVRVEDIGLGGFSPRTENLALGFRTFEKDFL